MSRGETPATNVRMARRAFEASPYHEGQPVTVCFHPDDYPGMDIIDGLQVALFSSIKRGYLRIVTGAKEVVG